MASPAEINIPTAIESPETLEFIGLTASTASTVFKRYQNRPDPVQCPDSLLDYAHGHISLLKTRHCVGLTPRQALTRVGLTQKLQDALLDPRFTDIFWTESLYYWVKDTLTINHETLYQLQQRLKNDAGQGSEALEQDNVLSGPQPGNQLPPFIATVNTTPQSHYLSRKHICLDAEGPLLPNHIALYKGFSPAETMTDDQWIRDDGSVEMQMLATDLGHDFNRDRRAWYWTPDKDMAEHHRQWVASRCTRSETWLIRIQVPLCFLSTLRRHDLWYSADWKEYVWCCKTRRMPPDRFSALGQEVDVVRGHVMTGVSGPVTRIRKLEDVQTTITDAWVLRHNGQRGRQWTFMSFETIKRMGDVIRGKIHVDITAAAEESGRFLKL